MRVFQIRKFLYVSIFLFPLLPYWGMHLASQFGHINLFAWWGIGFVAIVLAAIDHLVGGDPLNHDIESIKRLPADIFLRALPMAAVPIQVWLLVYGATVFARMPELNLIGRIGWIVSIGSCSCFLALIGGHEMIHKGTRIERAIGGILIASVCNPLFKIAHIRGHHARVATPLDPSSAELNQSFYHFFLRACAREVIDNWAREKARLNQKGHRVLYWRNELLCWSMLTAAIAAAFFSAWQWQGVIFFVGQGAVAFIGVSIQNYIGHYGLRRRQLPNGGYEQITRAHTWDSNYRLSNLALFNLPRHADHHVNPGRPYQALRHSDQSPQMPTGYLGMFSLALIPPLWFKTMNPRVAAYYEDRKHRITK